MKILIIGGTGLISTAISRQLVQAGHDLTLYNRGEETARFEGNYSVIRGNRNDFKTFEEQMANTERFDCVIDMICFKPEQAESDIRAFKGRVGQLIFCSTVDVYTKPPKSFPVRESDERKALSDYGRNKARCEDLFSAAHADGHFPVTILRPAHTYGDGGNIIHTLGWDSYFLDRLRQGKPVIVHGDGESLWVSCHIDDVGNAFVNAVGNEQTFGHAYHVTGEQWQTWNQYHERLADAIGAPTPTIVHIPADILVRISPEHAMTTYLNFQYTNIFDNSAAKADLNFKQVIDWETGAKRTYDWLVDNDQINQWETFPFYDRLLESFKNRNSELIAELANLNKR